MAELRNTDTQEAERAEREEMFGFHPEILAAAAELPRKTSGVAYEDADGAGRG